MNRRALQLSLIGALGLVLTSCSFEVETKESPIPKAQLASAHANECHEGPIKVTTLHEINAAEVRTGVNLFDDGQNEQQRVERRAYLGVLRYWVTRIQDPQTKACYAFWLDRAEEGNLTPASVEQIP